MERKNIALVIQCAVIILLLSYIAYGIFKDYGEQISAASYVAGYLNGRRDILEQTFSSTENCMMPMLTLGNQTRTLIDVACLTTAE